MSEAYSVFQRALTASVLEEYGQIPDEKTDESRFSPGFRAWAAKTIRKTQNRSWYYVNTTAKKAILIAIIVGLLAVTAMAIPAVRKKAVGFFVHEHEERYGITFEPEDVADAPKEIEVVYCPSTIPEGYWVCDQIITPIGASFWWENADGVRLRFAQRMIPTDPTNDQWIGIDSEGVEKTEVLVGEYTVTLFTDVDFRIAAWTDGSYFYMLNVDPSISLETMEKIILSVEPLE